MSTGSTYLRLEVISGNATGDTIVVEDELVIGRHADGAGRLSEDEEISRQHARISREATGDYAIEDLGSSNGTFVNGLRIQSPRLLALDDSIEVGATTLLVRAVVQPQPVQTPSAAAPPAPDRHSPTVFARSTVPSPAVAPAQEIASAAEAAAPVESSDPPSPPVPAPAGQSTPPPVPAQPAGDTASSPTPAPTDSETSTSPAPPQPAIEIPPLALKLEVDFEARQARITLGDSGAAVDMVFKDGSWRAALAGPRGER
jgi:hypothetical protein